MKKIILICCALLAQNVFANGNLSREAMKREIEFIAGEFETTYAPVEWKKTHLNWDLQTELQKSLAKIDDKAVDVGPKEFQRIVGELLRSTQDYHVGYSFLSTETAALPFAVIEVEGKFLISYVNRDKLSKEVFPFERGDEVKLFDGRPVGDVVSELAGQIGRGIVGTDRALGAWCLTFRRGSSGLVVPKGAVELTVRAQKSKVDQKIQLAWDYHPEDIQIGETNAVPMKATSVVEPDVSAKNFFRQFQMVNMDFADVDLADPNPFAIGAKKSFIPALGPVVWENPEDKYFSAYIYKNTQGKLIGYIRIPIYMASTEQFKEFKDIMGRYQKVVDALVIDEIDNPGGSLFYIYALGSVLTDSTLYTPLHHVKLYPDFIKDAVSLYAKIKDVNTDADAKKVLGEDQDGYPISMQSVNYIRQWVQFILEEWKSGKTLTSPNYFYAVDKINANADVKFTKPILVLVNELDFSGGDFFPTILQDNKRATIMGVRTAGAGGFIKEIRFPSAFGLERFSFTGSLAKRVNDQPIENLGVTPDVDYKLTVKDIQGNFEDYVKKINETVSSLK